MAKLLVQEPAGVREFELLKEETPIGRGKTNVLRLPHPSISNRHCVIRRSPAGFEIEDLNSSNGILLNGKRIQTTFLKDGDRVDLGEIRITFKASQPSDQGKTVAGAGAMEVPRATVRMRTEDLAKLHGDPSALAALPSPAEPGGALKSERILKILAGLGVGGDFHGADLSGARLAGTKLERADLNGADLSGADLQGANLAGASLYGANLAGANLKDANLERANLRKANLKGAKMLGTNLEGAILDGASQ